MLRLNFLARAALGRSRRKRNSLPEVRCFDVPQRVRVLCWALVVHVVDGRHGTYLSVVHTICQFLET